MKVTNKTNGEKQNGSELNRGCHDARISEEDCPAPGAGFRTGSSPESWKDPENQGFNTKGAGGNHLFLRNGMSRRG